MWLQGGTAAAGPYFNARNKEEPANSWPDDSKCAYLVELDSESQAKKGGCCSLPLGTANKEFLLGHHGPR